VKRNTELIQRNTASYWFSGLDDTWVKIKTQEEEAFTEHINSVDSNIKFTYEEAKYHKLPFLDCAVYIEEAEVSTLRFTGNLHIQTNTCYLTDRICWNTNWLSLELYIIRLRVHLPRFRENKSNISTLRKLFKPVDIPTGLLVKDSQEEQVHTYWNSICGRSLRET